VLQNRSRRSRLIVRLCFEWSTDNIRCLPIPLRAFGLALDGETAQKVTEILASYVRVTSRSAREIMRFEFVGSSTPEDFKQAVLVRITVELSAVV
jgi:hypothetical protein